MMNLTDSAARTSGCCHAKEQKPFSITARELAERGKDNIPDAFIPNCHLIYSSPETLAYNSPGAIGFGTKRAGLVIPESVMLLVSPSCCGRNSTILSQTEGYAERMFYLLQNETDLVTGRHLKKIPEAIREILKVCDPKPKVILICITCTDALLGTDLERICRQAQEETGVLVVPSYMYALEREGVRPPMVAIRKTIYSLLERKKVQPDMVNLMGFFSPLDPESEIFPLLKKAGIHKINQVSAMKTLEEYGKMGAANFNLVLDPLSRYAAEDLRKRLNMPYVELARLYDPDRIHHQYQLFAGALGIKMDDQAWYEKAAERRDAFAKKYRGKRFVVGEMANANPFELAAALVRMGMEVPMIVSNLTEAEFPYIRQLAEESPDTEIYTGISPSMVHFQAPDNIDAAIGKDAAAYCPDAAGVEWNGEKQPYGHKGVIDLLDALDQALQEGGHDAQERNEKTFYGSALRGEDADKRAASAEDQQA